MGQVNGGFRAATPNERYVGNILFGSGHWRRKKEERKRKPLFDMFGAVRLGWRMHRGLRS